MIDDEIEIAKLFNEYFVNIVKRLGLFTKEQSAISTENSLNLDTHLPKIFYFICFIESPLKMIKNAFYFILKAFLVLRIFKFLS